MILSGHFLTVALGWQTRSSWGMYTVHCTGNAGWYTKMHLQAFLSEKDVDEKKTLQGMKKMGQLLMWVLPGTGCERLRNT